MIFDMHAHLMGPEMPGKAFWDGFTRLAVVQTGRTEERIRQRLPDMWDLTGEQLLRDMDEAGVDHHRDVELQRSLVHGIDHRVVGEKSGSGVYFHPHHAQVVDRPVQ